MTEPGVAEAGWFYVEGDPPGTVRRWNGFEWIGFPIPDPTNSTGALAATGVAGARGAKQQRLRMSRSGALYGMLSVIAMVLLGTLLGVGSLRTFGGIDRMRAATSGLDVEVSLANVDSYIDDFGMLVLLSGLLVVVTAFVFIPWIRDAAETAQIHKVSGTGRPRREKRSALSIIVQIMVFGMLAPAWWILQAAVADITRGGNANRSLFGIVSDTAMTASIDPRTGFSGISPIKIIVWWALWWVPPIAGMLAWVAAWIFGPIEVDLMANLLRLTGVLLALEVASLVCIILTVVQISKRLN